MQHDVDRRVKVYFRLNGIEDVVLASHHHLVPDVKAAILQHTRIAIADLYDGVIDDVTGKIKAKRTRVIPINTPVGKLASEEGDVFLFAVSQEEQASASSISVQTPCQRGAVDDCLDGVFSFWNRGLSSSFGYKSPLTLILLVTASVAMAMAIIARPYGYDYYGDYDLQRELPFDRPPLHLMIASHAITLAVVIVLGLIDVSGRSMNRRLVTLLEICVFGIALGAAVNGATNYPGYCDCHSCYYQPHAVKMCKRYSTAFYLTWQIVSLMVVKIWATVNATPTSRATVRVTATPCL